MNIARHPDIPTLLTCSAGSQPEALCAVVASHISLCPKCLKQLREMERIGEALIDDIPPAVMAQPAPIPPENEPESSAVEQLRTTQHGSEVPRTLRHVLGNSLDALAWVAVAPGIHQHVVELSSGAAGDLRVLRIDPGVSIPEHGHRGEELSLVLRGACRDADGAYRIGDVMDLDDDTRHALTADETDGCILIVASEHPPEFAASWAA